MIVVHDLLVPEFDPENVSVKQHISVRLQTYYSAFVRVLKCYLVSPLEHADGQSKTNLYFPEWCSPVCVCIAGNSLAPCYLHSKQKQIEWDVCVLSKLCLLFGHFRHRRNDFSFFFFSWRRETLNFCPMQYVRSVHCQRGEREADC